MDHSQTPVFPAGFTVLFGGGDAGGFQVTSGGEVIPIDPYPATMKQLKKASDILETIASLKQQTAYLSNEQLQQHLNEVTRLATESLAESLKPLFARQQVKS
jgi:hypothetical protein